MYVFTHKLVTLNKYGLISLEDPTDSFDEQRVMVGRKGNIAY